MLQIIFFAIVLGISITLSGTKGDILRKGLESINSVMMSMVSIIMKIAPIGVFCLITKTFATQGIR